MLLVGVLVANSLGSMVSGFLVALRVPTSWCCEGCNVMRGEEGCGKLPDSLSAVKGWEGEKGAEEKSIFFPLIKE